MSELSNEDNNSSNQNKKHKENKRRYEKFGIPGKITINNYSCTYKDQSKADKNVFFYRCSKNNCKIIIEKYKENLNKIKDNIENTQIIFKQKNEHKCEKEEYLKKEEINNK